MGKRIEVEKDVGRKGREVGKNIKDYYKKISVRKNAIKSSGNEGFKR